jgi:Tfp pilus assembly protein PilO
MNLNRRLLIPLGVGVAVLVLWFVALWGPQGSALSSARKRASDATAQRETLRDQLQRLQDSRRDQPLKQSRLETMRVAVPDDPNLAQFILDANDAASNAGIDFLSITPTPPSAPAGGTTGTTAAGGAAAGGAAAPVPIRVGLTLTGGYYQVLNFVNLLDKLPRIVVVDNIALTAATAGTTQGLQATLAARIFTTSASPVAGATTGAGGGAAPGATTTTAPGATTTTTRTGGG